MIQQVLSHYHLPEVACLGLGLFMAVFVGVVGWVCRWGSDNVYAAMSLLPLQDEAISNKGEAR